MDIYSQNILDHAKSPRNFGSLADPKISGHGKNSSCGDKLDIDLKLSDNKVIDFKFSGQGCAISQAATSILGEQIIGKTIEEVLHYSYSDLVRILGIDISPRRVKCAALGLLTLQNIILRSRGKSEKTWSDL